MSMRSPAMAFSRAFSSARSGDPGAYDLFGSLIGCGTRRMPPNAANVDVAGMSLFVVAAVGVGMVEVGVDISSLAITTIVLVTGIRGPGSGIRDAWSGRFSGTAPPVTCREAGRRKNWKLELETGNWELATSLAYVLKPLRRSRARAE